MTLKHVTLAGLYLSSLTLPRPHASPAKPQEDGEGGGTQTIGLLLQQHQL